jgi:hypothetical protein
VGMRKNSEVNVQSKQTNNKIPLSHRLIKYKQT